MKRAYEITFPNGEQFLYESKGGTVMGDLQYMAEIIRKNNDGSAEHAKVQRIK